MKITIVYDSEFNDYFHNGYLIYDMQKFLAATGAKEITIRLD